MNDKTNIVIRQENLSLCTLRFQKIFVQKIKTFFSGSRYVARRFGRSRPIFCHWRRHFSAKKWIKSDRLFAKVESIHENGRTCSLASISYQVRISKLSWSFLKRQQIFEEIFLLVLILLYYRTSKLKQEMTFIRAYLDTI